MQHISISAKSQSYDVVLGAQILSKLGTIAAPVVSGRRALIVSDNHVWPLYGETCTTSLEEAGFCVHSFVVHAGEESKRFSVLTDLLEYAASIPLTRDDVICALGGGVVGDLTGYAAASYMRGCAYIQIPTSLLAMVDSSVGGKTAVNLEHGKNLAGAFWQPRAVLASIDCLDTIDTSLLIDSLGEVIKYGVLADPELFCLLENMPPIQTPLDYARFENIIATCIAIKRDIVEADELEHGLRQTLNLGHTIGHAVEAATDFTLGHGSCVALGMCIVARASAAQGLCPHAVAQRIEAVCAQHGLPTATTLEPDMLAKLAASDKKRHDAHLNMIVIEEIGKVHIKAIALSELTSFIASGYTPYEYANTYSI
ncbi:3-dehydroquinate synthase [Collinsella sp. zg1085]|uniref:3-dehydroquinate synthase n=1 Tax=Collinsella sp. zg1085 TaxID=2844380 RepID=UPI001C0B75B6|nr:3-dehydroquinate synthase [Collinsella sp. zg1085]QWT17069.1 3-dehydroquinate synthase [Collinsella sp. zg1085]